MPEFPIEVAESAPSVFSASWVDFPDVPAATGATPEAAFHALMDASLLAVARNVGAGRYAQPSPANGRATVSISSAQQLLMPHLGRLVGVTPNGSKMHNYSITNDFFYVE